MAPAPEPPTFDPWPSDPTGRDTDEEIARYYQRQERRQEWKDRGVRSAASLAVLFIAAFLLLVNPLLAHIASEAGVSCDGFDFCVVSPGDVIASYLKAAFLITLGSVLPVIVWQFFGFLVPELTRSQKRLLAAVPPILTLLFAAGAFLAMNQVAPRVLALLTAWAGTQ